MKFLGSPQEEGYTTRLREHLQNDVPLQFRQKRLREASAEEIEDAAKRFRGTLFNHVMMSVTHPNGRSKKQRASRAEVKKMAARRPLWICVRYHLAPRKRFRKAPGGRSRSRITFTLGEETGTATVCQEAEEEAKARPKRKAPHAWMGTTLFTQTKPRAKRQERRMLSFQTVSMKWTSATFKNGRVWRRRKKTVRHSGKCSCWWTRHGKELDPKHFAAAEKQAFDKSDKKEWLSWVKNKVVGRRQKL